MTVKKDKEDGPGLMCEWPRCKRERNCVYLGHALCDEHMDLVDKRQDEVYSEKWASYRDIRVDYSKGIHCPEFWRTCVECGEKHGPYKALAEAQRAHRCAECDAKMTERLRRARRRL